MRTTIRYTLMLILLAVASTLKAEEEFDAAARAKTIARFVDDQTVLIARVDVSRVEIDPLVDKIVEVIPEARVEEQSARADIKARRAAFCQAGGKDLYVIFSLAEIFPPVPAVPFVIVPVYDDTDKKALAAVFPHPPDRAPGQRQEVVELLDDVLFFGFRSSLTRLKAMQPDERPELVSAFEAAGNTAAQLLVLPTADNRRVIEELMPQLPEEIGGGPSTVLTRGLLWAAVGADTPPQMLLRLVIQSEDSQAASALRDKLVTTYEWLGRQVEVRQIVPKSDELTTLLTPNVQGDRLTLTLDEQNQGIAALFDVLAPTLREARNQTRRRVSGNNLKEIGLAMLNYESVNKAFPAAASYDADGKPLLSWRVHILPYMEQKQLYDQFHLDEPWDSEHNGKLIDRMPVVYRSPASRLKQKGVTSYLALVGPETAFPRQEGVELKAITDRTSLTIMVVEVDDDHAVVWTKPDDLTYDAKSPMRGLGKLYADSFNALMCDGSWHCLATTIKADTLRALFTRAGGEKIRYSTDLGPYQRH